jgi:hypothetical protein
LPANPPPASQCAPPGKTTWEGPGKSSPIHHPQPANAMPQHPRIAQPEQRPRRAGRTQHEHRGVHGWWGETKGGGWLSREWTTGGCWKAQPTSHQWWAGWGREGRGGGGALGAACCPVVWCRAWHLSYVIRMLGWLAGCCGSAVDGWGLSRVLGGGGSGGEWGWGWGCASGGPCAPGPWYPPLPGPAGGLIHGFRGIQWSGFVDPDGGPGKCPAGGGLAAASQVFSQPPFFFLPPFP